MSYIVDLSLNGIVLLLMRLLNSSYFCSSPARGPCLCTDTNIIKDDLMELWNFEFFYLVFPLVGWHLVKIISCQFTCKWYVKKEIMLSCSCWFTDVANVHYLVQVKPSNVDWSMFQWWHNMLSHPSKWYIWKMDQRKHSSSINVQSWFSNIYLLV